MAPALDSATCWPVDDFDATYNSFIACCGAEDAQASAGASCTQGPGCCCVLPRLVADAVFVWQLKILLLGLSTACSGVGILLQVARILVLHQSCLAAAPSGLCFAGAHAEGAFCRPEAGAALALALLACKDSVGLSPPELRSLDALLREDLLAALLRQTPWSALASSPWGVFLLWAAAARPAAEVASCVVPGSRGGLVAAAALEGVHGTPDATADGALCLRRAATLAAFAAAEVDAASRGRLLDAAQEAAFGCGGSERFVAGELEKYGGPPASPLASLALASCERLRFDVRRVCGGGWLDDDGSGATSPGGSEALPALLLSSDEVAERVRLRALAFESIYKLRAWTPYTGLPGGMRGGTLSGGGSRPESNRRLRRCLSAWAQRYGARSLLDIGCGDARWQASIQGVGRHLRYEGMDASGTALRRARERPENAEVLRAGGGFRQHDFALGLPRAGGSSSSASWDLALAQDVLQHLSDHDVLQIVHGLHAAKVRYFAATHHPRVLGARNRTCAAAVPPAAEPSGEPSGPRRVVAPNYGHRRLDLSEGPFFFPAPLEECEQAGRVLALWRVSDLPRGDASCFAAAAAAQIDVALSFERCCDERLGPSGDVRCWEGGLSFARCCRPRRQPCSDGPR